ncbi:MAG: molybdopterin-dependent oxidoreductase, partial [Gammaproteobacteria bacterium]|nr:molybdopterin-dependent oxidoreductase [Gammaproteobacteria bacterium]
MSVGKPSAALELPASLAENPDLDRWVRILPDRSVRIGTGKVEMGQGIVTALCQIAAEELDLPIQSVRMLSGSSAEGPDERYTTASLSVEVSGASIRLVCAELRTRMLEHLARRLNCALESLSVENGEFLADGEPTGFDYWRLADEVDLRAPLQRRPPLKPTADYRLVGRSVARLDLPD